MAATPNQRNWNDVQTAIATVAIVSTLGLWNLFATPVAKPKTQETQPPPPPTEDPAFVNASPTALPHIKIMFATQLPPQAVVIPQQQQPAKKHRNNNSGGGGIVTTTKTS